MREWAGLTPVPATDKHWRDWGGPNLSGRSRACQVGGAVLGLTTVGWDAIVDNVVVLGVALPVRAKAVELSYSEIVAVGKEGGRIERVCAGCRAQVGALASFPTYPGRALSPSPFQMKKLRL